MVYSKDDLLKLNKSMLRKSLFKEDKETMIKDDIGYSLSDYYIMRHIAFLKADELTDLEFYMIAVTLQRYPKQMLNIAMVNETVTAYEKKCGITPRAALKQRKALKGRNKDKIPAEYIHLYKTNNEPEIELIQYNEYFDTVDLYAKDCHRIRGLKQELDAKWIPHKDGSKTIFYFRTKRVYLPVFLEEMAHATEKKSYVPSDKLAAFMRTMKSDDLIYSMDEIKTARKIERKKQQINEAEQQLNQMQIKIQQEIEAMKRELEKLEKEKRNYENTE